MSKTKGKIQNVDVSKNHVMRIEVREEDKDGKHLHTYVLTVPPSWNKHQILEELNKKAEPMRKKRKKMVELLGSITEKELEDALNS